MMLDNDTYTQVKQPDQPADIEQANRMRKELEMAAQAAEGFRKQEFVARQRAEQAERVAESCRAALNVLETDSPQSAPYPNGESATARY